MDVMEAVRRQPALVRSLGGGKYIAGNHWVARGIVQWGREHEVTIEPLDAIVFARSCRFRITENEALFVLTWL